MLKISASFEIICVTLTVEHYVYSAQKGKHSLYSLFQASFKNVRVFRLHRHREHGICLEIFK